MGNSVEVSSGRVSRVKDGKRIGGFEYTPGCILDSVLLADNIVDLETLPDVLQQLLA